MVFRYCPQCGNKTEKKIIGDDGNVPYCTICNIPLFSFSYSCILTLVIDENSNFAFIQQDNRPEHLYVGVAGYPMQGEIFEDAVKREVMEEIGLTVDKVKYIKSYYYIKKDMIMVGFVSVVKHSDFILSREVDNAKWFTKDEVIKVLPVGSIILQLFKDFTQ